MLFIKEDTELGRERREEFVEGGEYSQNILDEILKEPIKMHIPGSTVILDDGLCPGALTKGQMTSSGGSYRATVFRKVKSQPLN